MGLARASHGHGTRTGGTSRYADALRSRHSQPSLPALAASNKALRVAMLSLSVDSGE